MIVYPATGFDSWSSLIEADLYFANRLRGAGWDLNEDEDKEKALMQAFIRIAVLGLKVTLPIDTDMLTKLKTAQMEQAFYELRHDTDNQSFTVKAVDLDGVKVNWSQATVDAYPQIVLALLRDYIPMKTIRGLR